MMRGVINWPRATIGRVAACQCGSMALEMAFVLPALVLLIIGTIYSGWMIYSTTMLSYAVESAARCVAVATVNSVNCGGNSVGAQSQATQNYAVTQAMGVDVTAANFTVAQLPNGCGWQVTANYQFTFLLPFQASNPVYTISPSACFPIQS
jgi:Flp pilus assembly protein TadG